MNYKVSRTPSLVIRRTALKAEKLVYVITANKSQRYPYGRSKILYIGMTKVGAFRVAHSAVDKAYKFLQDYGTKELRLHIITCTKIPGVPTWSKLERALILTFRSVFGDVPKGNKTGRRMKWRDEKKYFRFDKLEHLLDRFV